MPFTATSISQAAAIASLDAADELLARTDAVVAERTRVSELCATPDSPCRRRRRISSGCRWDRAHLDFVEQAADARIVVRPYGSDGVRVTIGAPEENDALLKFAQNWI